MSWVTRFFVIFGLAMLAITLALVFLPTAPKTMTKVVEIRIPCPEPVIKEGPASWYGYSWQGRQTAGGDPFDAEEYSLATLEFPIGSFVIVTNLENGKQAVAVVNDHGPYWRDRKFDLSLRLAKKLGLVTKGVSQVRVQLVEVK